MSGDDMKNSKTSKKIRIGKKMYRLIFKTSLLIMLVINTEAFGHEPWNQTRNDHLHIYEEEFGIDTRKGTARDIEELQGDLDKFQGRVAATIVIVLSEDQKGAHGIFYRDMSGELLSQQNIFQLDPDTGELSGGEKFKVADWQLTLPGSASTGRFEQMISATELANSPHCEVITKCYPESGDDMCHEYQAPPHCKKEQ